jgi:hypothetical protein
LSGVLPHMMDWGLDHLVYATPDLDASVECLAKGFGAEPGRVVLA